jgi:hypothetical protein
MTGAKIDVAYGEGFRQHLGHAYPQENLLMEVLKSHTQIITTYKAPSH